MELMLGIVPTTYFLLSAFISCVALNVSQPYRPYFLLPILFPAFKSFISMNYLDVIIPGLAQIWGQTVLIHLVHITSVLYLEKWKLHPKSTNWNLHAAYKIWGNPQLLNTHRQVRNARNNLSPNLSRIRFLAHRCLQLAILYLAHKYVVTKIFPDAFMPLFIDSFAPAQEKYISRLFTFRLTIYETLLRAVVAVHWIWINVFGLHLTQTAVAILFSVILRWDEPCEWPSLFGSPFEAYSLRRFWGQFWHRIVVRPYTTYGLHVSRACGIPVNSTAEKLVTAVFVFLLSGIAHSLVTWQTIGCGYWRDIHWFLMNAVAAVGETLVAKWCKRMVAYETKGEMKKQKPAGKSFCLHRVLGTIWVFLFFFWSVPKWEYGKIYCVARQMAT